MVELKVCPFQNRDSCNYGVGFDRCKNMVFKEGKWICMLPQLNEPKSI